MTAAPQIVAKPLERRRHQRVKVALLGRYMLADRREFPCRTLDISPGGVAILGPVAGQIGERVVVYLDHLGRLEGQVVRHVDSGFAMTANVPAMKREKIADQLTWLANRHALGLPEDRRHERIVPRSTRTKLTLSDGHHVAAKIIDVSISGVALTVDPKPPLGSAVTVGGTMGRVVRVFATGAAIEFSRMLPAETFGTEVHL